MKILVFDVETTGLPAYRNARLSDTYNWPFVVQLSWLVYDTSNNRIVKVVDKIIRLPEGYGIKSESSKIHGITTAKMLQYGVPLTPLLHEFMTDARTANVIVAHNIKFDRSMITVEQIRHGFQRTLSDLRRNWYCTMGSGTSLCNIRRVNKRTGKSYLKYPKLSELHERLFKTTPGNLHDSLIDILVCFRCFGMLAWGVDLLECNRNFVDRWDKAVKSSK